MNERRTVVATNTCTRPGALIDGIAMQFPLAAQSEDIRVAERRRELDDGPVSREE
jgi:hypothetical protein